MNIIVTTLPYLIGVFAIATLTVLVGGLLAMACNGVANDKYSNLLMRWRVSLQGMTLGLLALHIVLTSFF
jgi:hypothetical protein